MQYYFVPCFLNSNSHLDIIKTHYQHTRELFLILCALLWRNFSYLL